MDLETRLVEEAREQGITRFVVGAVVVMHSRVLLLARPRHEFMGGIYELPSGKVERGEAVLSALERELNEETGLRIAQVRQFLGHFDYDTESGVVTRQFNFAVSGQEPLGVELQEHDAYAWVARGELAVYPVTDHVRQVIGLAWGEVGE